VHALFPNNARVYKTTKNLQVEGLLKQRTMGEANEFKQTDRKQGLKTHTPQGNIGRNYKENKYSGNVMHFIHVNSDIPPK
jgi:hypothetical protein